MTVIPSGHNFNRGHGTSSDVPDWVWSSGLVIASLALVGWGVISTIGLLSALLASAAAGFVIGWVRLAFSRKNRFGESLISALFGAKLTRDPLPLVFLDLFARSLAGLAVGIAFAKLGVITADPAIPILVKMIGGAGGGGPDFSGLAVSGLFLLIAALLIGMILIVAIEWWAGMVLKAYLFDATALAKFSTMGATKGVIKDAVVAQWTKHYQRLDLGRSAAKGAATGVLVGIILTICGLKS